MSTRCPPGAYLDRARRELSRLDAALRHAEAVAATTALVDGDGVGATDRRQVLDALATRRSAAEARLARMVFNGDDVRAAAAAELERALCWLRCGLAALAADAAADTASLPATYYAAAEQQVRAWRAALDLVAVDACDPDRSTPADVTAAAIIESSLAGASRCLRWGPATGSLDALRQQVEAQLAQVRTRWAALADQRPSGPRAAIVVQPLGSVG